MRIVTKEAIKDKNVIVRFDYNVPIKDGKILDDTRIKMSLKTLNFILENSNKIVILSHLGRIKNEEDKKNNSLKPVCEYLSKILDKKIVFCEYQNEEQIIKDNDIIMMENTRYFDLDNNKESNSDDELSKYFASFGEVFINDAFGASHRNNASNVGITKYLPSYNGFLMEEEVNNLNKLLNDCQRPYVVIMGGKKVSDKIKIIDNLIKKVDKLILGGALVYTFLKAKNIDVGSSLVEDDYIEYSKNLLDNYSDKLVLIDDNYVEGNVLKNISDMNKNDIGFDIGNNTVEKYKEVLKDAKTIFFNGPVGAFEDGYEYGTREIINFLNSLDSFILIGGGDTVNAVNKYSPNNKFVISSGGGASLEYLEGNKLPGIIED